MIEWNQVKYIDCMDEKEGLPSLPDKSVDLCLTDPPFNMNYKGTRRRNKQNKYKVNYDDYREDYDDWCKLWFTELKRICKGIILLPGNQNIPLWFKIEEPYDMFIWYKKNSPGIGRCYWFTTHEILIVYGKLPKRLKHSVLYHLVDYAHHRELKTIHPTPKPTTLMFDIINQLRPTSVIDPFLGSGTTAEVCTKLGIPWVGFEINEVYSQDINKRLKNCKKEPKQIELELYNSEV
jgi:DNA modification methylase